MRAIPVDQFEDEIRKARASTLEAKMSLILRAMRQDRPQMPETEREVRFDKKRRWRFDFTLGERVAIECNGGTWVRGRHNRGSSIEKDYEKLNAAQAAGWIVLQFTSDMLDDVRYVEEIIDAALTGD